MRLILVLLLTALPAYGQIEGPKTADLKETVFIKVKVGDLNDPKIEYAPKSDRDKFTVLRDFQDNSPVIIFSTSTPQTYHFIVAGNKDNKTILHTHTLQVGTAPGPGPGPGPGPTPPADLAKLIERIKPAYLTFPNETEKAQMIDDFRKLSTMTFANNKAAFTELMKVRPGLVGVRAELTNFFVEQFGNSATQVHPPTHYQKVFKLVVDALASL